MGGPDGRQHDRESRLASRRPASRRSARARRAGARHRGRSERAERGAMLIEMAIKGLMIDQVTSTPIIVLRDKDASRVLEIWVGVFEANAIAVQIENTTSPRPMTHDLLKNVIEDLQGRVERVVISDVREGTYYAIIHLSVRGDAVAIDARPSDAIALALRAKAPIF